jgi:hypothetical protein
MKTQTKVLIASAIIIFASGILVAQKIFQTPQAAFKKLITTPIPNSVRTIEEKHFLTMDSSFWVLRFEIERTDLQTMLTSQHFTPIDESQEFKRWDQKSQTTIKIQKEDYLNSWKQRIQNTVKLDIRFSGSWQIFTLKEGNGTKYFFFDTNSTDAVFVADVH